MTTTGAQPQSTPAGAKPTLAAPAPHPQGSAAPSSSSSSGPPRYLPRGLGLLAGGCPAGRGAPPFRAPVAATLHRGGRGEGGHRLLPAGQRSGAGRSRGGHRLSPPLPASPSPQPPWWWRWWRCGAPLCRPPLPRAPGMALPGRV